MDSALHSQVGDPEPDKLEMPETGTSPIGNFAYLAVESPLMRSLVTEKWQTRSC